LGQLEKFLDKAATDCANGASGDILNRAGTHAPLQCPGCRERDSHIEQLRAQIEDVGQMLADALSELRDMRGEE